MAKHIPLALAAVLGACFGPTAPLGVPCAPNNDCPAGQMCNPETRRCEPPTGLEAWLDDTVADFAVEGAVADGAEVERQGFVGPVAYFAGGLRLSGIDRHAIPDRNTTWNEIAGLPRTGTTFVRTAEINFGDAPPLGLGLSGADNITVLVEGEVYLGTAGRWGFQLEVDDIGFIEIAPPGSSTFERLVTDEDNNTPPAYYTVVTPGWHRLRGAFADRAAEMDFDLRVDDPGGGNFKPILAADLRAPAGDVAGVAVDGFNEPYLIAPTASVVHPGTLAGQTYDADPYGLAVGSTGFSLRFNAQVLIDVDGSYAFRIETGQGHRAWLDGMMVADRFGTAQETSTTEPMRLEPGWHDLVIDLHRLNGADARFDLTVASGPAWVGETIPLDHLRPVIGRQTRWAGGLLTGSVTVPDSATATRTMTFDVPNKMVASHVDAVFQVNHPQLAALLVRVDPPAAGLVTIAPAGTVSGTNPVFGHGTVPPSTAGNPVQGTWSVLVTDTAVADTITGTFGITGVTVLGAADPPPFPNSYRYVSAPRDLGGVASIARVKWALRQTRPDAPVTVSIRTCDSAACDGEPWTVATDGGVPAVPPRRFAQYMVEMTSNGDVPTALDWIEIRYLPETD